MTSKELTRERNIFIVGFLCINSILFSFPLIGDVALPYYFMYLIMLLLFGSYMYFTYRLSHFLGHRLWLTAIFCVLITMSLIGITITFLGLIFSVYRTRKKLVRAVIDASD